VVVADQRFGEALRGRLPPRVLLDVDSPGEEYHFGRRLAQVVTSHELERPVYIGCGMPLIKGDELAAVASVLSAADIAVVSNNFYSADLAGFVPGRVVRDVELPDNDRALPRVLVQEGGLLNQALPRTAANQFDIDTPVDLAILGYAGGAGPRLTAWLAAHPAADSRLAEAARLFTDTQAVVAVAGRISSEVLNYLQSETASQTRLYSEERGMQSMGRDVSGEARTLLGFHIEAVGPRRFFEEMARMANALFLDSRTLFAHVGRQPSRADRFLSDALEPDAIGDEWVREFTRAARDATIPVVLGGQSLVTYGVQLLAEAAWKEHDRVGTEWRAQGRAAPRPPRPPV
jgi:hypothetical protein